MTNVYASDLDTPDGRERILAALPHMVFASDVGGLLRVAIKKLTEADDLKARLEGCMAQRNSAMIQRDAADEKLERIRIGYPSKRPNLEI